MRPLRCACAGPVDAAYKAVDSLVRVDASLVDYGVNSVTEGIEALAHTRVIIRPAGKLMNEAFAESTRGMKVQRTFSGAPSGTRGGVAWGVQRTLSGGLVA